MKWPENSPVSPEVRQHLNARLAEFSAQDKPEDSESQGTAVQSLVKDLYLIFKGIPPNTPEAPAARAAIESAGSVWDTNDPEFTHAQKLINRYMKGQLLEAGEYSERLVDHRAGEGRKLKRDLAVENADKKHAPTNEIKRQVIEVYQTDRNHWKTKKAAARELERRFPGLSFSTIYDALKGL